MDSPDRYDNHARQALPESERASSYSIALITFGIGTTLPVFWLGAEVMHSVGSTTAAWLFAVVCGALGILSVATGMVGSQSRLSTYMVLHFAFGRHGAKLLNLIIAITLIGFYAATLDAFGQAASSTLGHYFPSGSAPGAGAYVVAGSILMTGAAVVGIRGLEGLSTYTVPLMALFILYTVTLSFGAALPGQFADYAGAGGSVTGAISSTIGMVVMMPVLMPDVTRYAHGLGGCLAAGAGIALGFPLVLLAGGLPSILTGQNGIAENMAHFGIFLPALFILLVSNWITNTANLYSATLTLATISSGTDRMLTIVASVLGTVLAMGGFMGHFEQFLFGLSIFIPPIASIYLVDFYLLRDRRYDTSTIPALPAWRWSALLAWSIACVVAWLGSYRGYRFTTIPTVDALLTAAVVYPLLYGRFQGRLGRRHTPLSSK